MPDLAWLHQAILYVSDRYDKYSDVGADAFSPKVWRERLHQYCISMCICAAVGVKTSVVPTFNDLYYPGYSNPALYPERSNAFDIGMCAAAGQSDRHNFQATYYDIQVQDKIVSEAPDYIPVQYCIRHTQGRGSAIRLSFIGRGNDCLRRRICTAFPWIKSSPASPTYNKQLPYVPKFTGLAGIAVQTSLCKIDIHESFMGLRYTDALKRIRCRPMH